MKLKDAPPKTLEKVIMALSKAYDPKDFPRMVAMTVARYDIRKQRIGDKWAYRIETKGHSLGLGIW